MVIYSLLRSRGVARPLAVALLLGSGGTGAQDGAGRLPGGSAAVAQTVWGILGYTRWPEKPSPVQLCLAGETVHAAALLEGAELSGGRKLLVRRIDVDAPQPLLACHALYTGRLQTGQWAQLMAAWPSGQPLLTLSENAADCAAGGMFCLSITPKAVSFELNLDSMARSGVRVNPRVLGLARHTEGR